MVLILIMFLHFLSLFSSRLQGNIHLDIINRYASYNGTIY